MQSYKKKHQKCYLLSKRRKIMKHNNIFLSIILCFFLLNAKDYLFSQDKLYTIDDLVSSSNFIVLGKVTSISNYEGGNGRIYSDIKFQVSKVYKGKIQTDQELNFTFMGGELGKRRTTVLEYPHFTKNNESILFLNQINDNKKAQNAFLITGLIQGKFDILSEDGNDKKICRDKFMSLQMNIHTGNEIKTLDNNRTVLLSEFVKQLELLINH